MSLVNKKCIPCEGGIPPLSESEIIKIAPQISAEWEIIDHRKISRQFKFKNFKGSMKFVSEVADLAESEGHHPDIQISWNKVTLVLWTHAIGGLSENDFILGAKIENLINKK